MENNILNKLSQAENAPQSFLTEITENELLNMATETQNASDTFRPAPEEPTPQQVYEGAPYNPQPQNQFNAQGLNSGGNINLGKVLNAKFGVTIIDNVVPLMFVFLLRFGLDIKTSKKDFQLTARERDEIEPFVQGALDHININMSNPFVALGVVMAAVYGSKGAEVGLNKYFEKEEAKESKKSVSGYNMDGTVKKDGRGRPRK